MLIHFPWFMNYYFLITFKMFAHCLTALRAANVCSSKFHSVLRNENQLIYRGALQYTLAIQQHSLNVLPLVHCENWAVVSRASCRVRKWFDGLWCTFVKVRMAFVELEIGSTNARRTPPDARRTFEFWRRSVNSDEPISSSSDVRRSPKEFKFRRSSNWLLNSEA